ncbi:hypothetical protein B296_00013017 [Ensete ventricosum]|uniref:Uncharacterized protein n=1 Tax=Ensete ventricosum TaxID=4639 RepID=A0A426ZJY7_ENSVE|nr:hypothetical protein B296_00013017 [Ensete ventricosum]
MFLTTRVDLCGPLLHGAKPHGLGDGESVVRCLLGQPFSPLDTCSVVPCQLLGGCQMSLYSWCMDIPLNFPIEGIPQGPYRGVQGTSSGVPVGWGTYFSAMLVTPFEAHGSGCSQPLCFVLNLPSIFALGNLFHPSRLEISFFGLVVV